MESKDEKLHKAAEYIVSAVYPSLELEKDTEAALRQVRLLVKAKLEEQRWTLSPYEMAQLADARERVRRGEIDPRDVYI